MASLAPPRPRPRGPAPVVEVEPEGAPLSLARLDQSAQAYQRASQLHEGVADRLRRIDEATERHLVAPPLGRRATVSPEMAQALAWLRSPRAARQAVLASVILGPPRAGESP
jgi:hypothetical protein